MEINKETFDKIKGYISGKLTEYLIESQIKDKAYIIGTLEMCTIDSFLKETGEKKERVKKPASIEDNGFELVWKAYPPSGNFTYKGITFTSSRALRANYQVCEMLYMKGLTENKVTGEQIVKAINKQLSIAKRESFEAGENRLNYLPALEVFLRQSRYMAFIDNGPEDKEDETGNESINWG